MLQIYILLGVCVAIALIEVVVYLCKKKKKGDAKNTEKYVTEIDKTVDENKGASTDSSDGKELKEGVDAAEILSMGEEVEKETVLEEADGEMDSPEAEEEERALQKEDEEENSLEESEDEEGEEEEESGVKDLNKTEKKVKVFDGVADIGGDKIYYRYSFSFRAKLIQSSDEVKSVYGELMDIVKSYEKLRARESWKQIRVSCGRKTLALILFKGSRLCVAYALNPAELEETKYRGEDMSDKKRFAKTPMLLRLTSNRRIGYAKHLLRETAEREGLIGKEIVPEKIDMPYQTTAELIQEKLVKVLYDRKYNENATLIRASIKDMIREKISMTEAHAAITDKDAESLIEYEAVYSAGDGLVKGGKKYIINIDTLSDNFSSNDEVTVKAMKEKGLIPAGAGQVKVLARGTLNKPLKVYATDFSMDAVKMILLTGGRVFKI